jgi:hypothetical protein
VPSIRADNSALAIRPGETAVGESGKLISNKIASRRYALQEGHAALVKERQPNADPGQV